MIAGDIYAGRAVLVTGGSSGIGLAIAQSFARLGATLADMVRLSEELHSVAQAMPCRVACANRKGFDNRPGGLSASDASDGCPGPPQRRGTGAKARAGRGADPRRGRRHLRHRPPPLQGRVPVRSRRSRSATSSPASSSHAARASTSPRAPASPATPTTGAAPATPACAAGSTSAPEQRRHRHPSRRRLRRVRGLSRPQGRHPARWRSTRGTAPSASRSPARCTASTSARRRPASACS